MGTLLVSRRVGESLYLKEDEIEIKVLEANPGRVSLGVKAPKHVKIWRVEVESEQEGAKEPRDKAKTPR